MKNFQEFISENNDYNKIIRTLHKTKKSLDNHLLRSSSHYSMNNRRTQDLVDRYNHHKDTLYNTDDGRKAWKKYCKDTGSRVDHDGYDLLA